MAVSSRSGGCGVEWSWACRPRRGVAKRGNCGPFGTGCESHAPGSERCDTNSRTVERCRRGSGVRERRPAALRTGGGRSAWVSQRSADTPYHPCPGLRDEGRLGLGSWPHRRTLVRRVPGVRSGQTPRIARIGPRNERRLRRRGSRCSGDHEGNRVSVRPDRTLKSSEEHRERCGVVLVE
jgi:hypothetical protein